MRRRFERCLTVGGFLATTRGQRWPENGKSDSESIGSARTQAGFDKSAVDDGLHELVAGGAGIGSGWRCGGSDLTETADLVAQLETELRLVVVVFKRKVTMVVKG